MKKWAAPIVFSIAFIFAIGDFYATKTAKAANDELNGYVAISKEFLKLKTSYKNGDESKKILEEISSDASKIYFSTSVSKKDLASSNMTLNLLILNGDELDAITKRVLNSNLKISKLWIEDAQIGYLLSLEVSP